MSTGGITAIIISKGLETLLSHCLLALKNALANCDPDARHHIVVVDNATPFPYIEAPYRELGAELVRFDTPQSFAAANNYAAAFRPNRHYLLLNNDVLLSPRAVGAMADLIQSHSRAGICGTRLLFPDGTIQHCGVVFGAGTTGPYHYLRKKPSHLVSRAPSEWQAVTGACMLVKDALWDALEGFNPSFAFGLEDIDLCLRARQMGWRVFCCNKTDSLHFESMTPGRVALDVGSRKRFMQIWQGHYTIDG